MKETPRMPASLMISFVLGFILSIILFGAFITGLVAGFTQGTILFLCWILLGILGIILLCIAVKKASEVKWRLLDIIFAILWLTGYGPFALIFGIYCLRNECKKKKGGGEK